jgi:YegS/Rv2252/BmrU family lipid kinase
MIPVIFNPSARSATASDRVVAIQELSGEILLCPTSAAGDARRLAKEWADRGAPTIIASGGDGTINEVVQGIQDSENADQTALGLLPAGTMNIFALELQLPSKDLVACWKIIAEGQKRALDVWEVNGRAFIQLAGAGLDAEIIRQTSWESKKSFGPLSYVLAAMHVVGRTMPAMQLQSAEGREMTVSAVLLGNGKHYGAPIKVFPDADNTDRLLDVLAVENAGMGTLLSTLGNLLVRGGKNLPEGVHYFQTSQLEITAPEPISWEVDGELLGAVGHALVKRRAHALTVYVPK